jgi:tRNA A37 threonylcarbamoyladenosine dehydratase
MMRFSRLENLIGKQKMSLLKSKRVMIFGLGGVGSFAAEALIRSGISYVTVVDYDVVDVTNINRQLIATDDTIGLAKVDVFKARAKILNSKAQIVALNEKVSYDNIEMFFEEKPDFVLDCIDDVEGKIALAQICEKKKIPMILAMGFANKFHPEDIQIGPLKKTTVCPLAKVMRKRFRDLGLSLDIPCVYSTESPSQVMDKNILGSTAYTPSSAGLIMASYVVNQLLKERK